MENEEIITFQKQRIEIQNHTINSQLVEITELHKKNTGLLKKVGELEEKIIEITSIYEQENKVQSEKINEQEKECQEIKYVKQELLRQVESFKAKFAGQEIKIKELEEQKTQLQNQVLQIESSKSWKITEPLRRLLWRVKGD